jgi:hypothetical protein
LQRAIRVAWNLDPGPRLRGVEAMPGEAAAALEAISDSTNSVDGPTFVALAQRTTQIVGGEFRAYDEGNEEPWIVVRAVDSSPYDLESNDRELLERIRRSFRMVDDIPGV